MVPNFFWTLPRGWQMAAMLLDAGLKGLILFGLAGLCCFARRKASASARYLIWLGTLLGAACFPLLSWWAPISTKSLWTVGAEFNRGNRLALAVSLLPAQATGQLAEGPVNRPGPNRGGATAVSGQVWQAQLPNTWVNVGLSLWAAGVLVLLARLCLEQVRLRVLLRGASPLYGEDWAQLREELAGELAIQRPVLLLESAQNLMPVTWGFLRPLILLPANANQWTAERKRVVLLHELAHIKRWDSLSQSLAQLICAIYWFNPGAWIALRQMLFERERACDDLVLGRGLQPSSYAAHLMEIARDFRRLPRAAGIAMARASHLEARISSIVQPSRSRRLGPLGLFIIVLALGFGVLAVGQTSPGPGRSNRAAAQALLHQQIAQLQRFSRAKFEQSQVLASGAGQSISSEFQLFFSAATNGDFQTVTNMYEDFKRRHPQYSKSDGAADSSLSTPYWSPVLEICLAYDQVVRCEPKYTTVLADGIIRSIPPGSIYFGGTDPGRGVPTAFEKSQIDGDPFFILTQNALADGTYLEYLRQTYGRKIYTPTDEDSQRSFAQYSADALRRLEHDRQHPQEPKQIRSGEVVRAENGKAAVSGQVAVMSINALLVRTIFERNPGREFYIEESFPLEWMYPYLEPDGLILKINRETLGELPEQTLEQDRSYWQRLIGPMAGDWIRPDTSVREIAGFVDKIFVRKDLREFTGDAAFIGNDYAKRIFSKLRSSIAGVYAWRADHASNETERQRMTAEADLAFRQAFVLCPYSPEAVFRYSAFLNENKRAAEALLIAGAAVTVDPRNSEFKKLVQRLSIQTESQ